MDYIRVRIKGTGQVIDMVPAAALARIEGGTAERVEVEENKPGPVTAAVNKIVEHAVKVTAPIRNVAQRRR